VGANGSGKTTLLKILADEIKTDFGKIQYPTGEPVIHFCPQRIETCNDSIIHFNQNWDKYSLRLKDQLNLSEQDFGRWSTLSPGERKKWQIGAALAQIPDILLLDEPTNHLDVDGAALLLDILKQFSGIGILVSHNRFFLDTLTTHTIWLENGNTQILNHPYTESKSLVDSSKKEAMEKRESLRDEQKKVQRQLRSLSNKQGAADKNISHKSRMKGIRDHDGRSMAAKGRAIHAEKKLGQNVTKTKGELNRITENLQDHFVEKELGGSLFLEYVKSEKNPIVSLHIDAISVSKDLLIKDSELVINRDSKIHLAGPNGSGKTTLITHLIENLRIPESRLLYLPQELTVEDEKELLDKLLHLPKDQRGKIFQFLAALGLSYDKLSFTERPSPGEARKLLVAEGLSRQAWFLILDEPTNHLDLPSIERLEMALSHFPGALLLVTHDEHLAKACTKVTLEIRDFRLRERN